MKPTKQDAQLTEELARLAEDPRVLVPRHGAPRKDGLSVVYCMQRTVRPVDNPQLDFAIEEAKLPAPPLLTCFRVIPNYPNANLRQSWG
jgi:hypothetical protein